MISKNEKRILHNIRKEIGKTINKYSMVSANDKVLVPLSGGKDSFVLLNALVERKRYLPIDYEILALHINIENISYEIDRSYIQSICDKLNVPFYYKSLSIDMTDSKKSVCFMCTWRRRTEIFSFAEEYRCNRIAFGHHMDDIIETLIMNMFFQGSVSTIPPKLKMFNGELDVIRPLFSIPEEKLIEYSKILGFQKQKKECPYSDKTQRKAVKDMLHQFHDINDKVKYNLFSSMTNIQSEYLPSE